MDTLTVVGVSESRQKLYKKLNSNFLKLQLKPTSLIVLIGRGEPVVGSHVTDETQEFGRHWYRLLICAQYTRAGH